MPGVRAWRPVDWISARSVEKSSRIDCRIDSYCGAIHRTNPVSEAA